MRNRLDDLEHDFTAWLLGLNGMRAAMSSDEIAAAAIAGAREGFVRALLASATSAEWDAQDWKL